MSLKVKKRKGVPLQVGIRSKITDWVNLHSYFLPINNSFKKRRILGIRFKIKTGLFKFLKEDTG